MQPVEFPENPMASQDNSISTEVPRPPNLSENLELALREEIRATQVTQASAVKWKLISISALGGLALGLVEPPADGPPVKAELLCLIPILCLYWDLMYLHLVLRCITVGAFIKRSYEASGSRQLSYEEFVFAARLSRGSNPFNLEITALLGVSVTLDLILIGGMLFNFLFGQGLLGFSTQQPDFLTATLLPLSALVGLIGSRVIYKAYDHRIRTLSDQSIERGSNSAVRQANSNLGIDPKDGNASSPS